MTAIVEPPLAALIGTEVAVNPDFGTFDRIVEIMREIHSVGKEGEFIKDGRVVYKFRGVDAVMQAVGPLLRKYRILPIPEITQVEQKEYGTKTGGKMISTIVHVTYRIRGPHGPDDDIVIPMRGEAADYGDKSLSKACAVAYRVMWIQLLCIPTGDPDPDLANFERGDYDDNTPPPDSGRGRPRQDTAPRNDAELHSQIIGQLATAIEAVRTLRDETVAQSNKRTADYCQERLETNVIKATKDDGELVIELRRLSLANAKILLARVNRSISEIETHNAETQAARLAQEQEV